MPVDLSTIDVPKVIDTIIVLIGLFGGIFGAHGLAVKNKGKTVISALSDAFTNVATAAKNENVSEDEFQAIVNDGIAIHNALVPDNAVSKATVPAVTPATNSSTSQKSSTS